AALLLGMAVVIWNRNIAKYAAATQKYAAETQAYADSVNIANEALKQTQSKLVQSEKMASLGTLTAGVAHEINNPTNFVHVGVHNLEADLHEVYQFIHDLAGENAEQAVLDSFKLRFDPLFAHINTIKSGTERIKTIVQDLRSFSRMDDIDKKAVDIRECIRSTVNLVRTKSLHVTDIITNFEAIPAVYCHPAQLNQVFMNLIVNSCDAIEEKQSQAGNKSLGKIVIGCKMHESDVEISVQDNGIGMSDATINKMFEPFFTTKEVGEGTGLGMAISFGIIEEHGGLIAVESTQGTGSLITVRLPVLPEVTLN
ncbi:MAG: HAMP domain-containing histidine kinase, partial [Algicola sp.]|nr:HAMP domain-containing histidine kinase [Algicola sp.]